MNVCAKFNLSNPTRNVSTASSSSIQSVKTKETYCDNKRKRCDQLNDGCGSDGGSQ